MDSRACGSMGGSGEGVVDHDDAFALIRSGLEVAVSLTQVVEVEAIEMRRGDRQRSHRRSMIESLACGERFPIE